MFAPLCALLLAAAPSPPPRPQPECHSSGTQRACGFHCYVGNGEVTCAQTPEGLCTRVEGKTLCWDPPEAVRFHPPKTAVAPECRAKFSERACGYRCQSSPNHVACNQTPYGTCLVHYDSVQCWDPSDALIHAVGEKLPKAECVTAGEKVACGYHCQASRSRVACAQTPAGTCVREGDVINCFDPPLPRSDNDLHEVREEASRLP